MEALSPGHVLVIAVVAAVLFFGWRQLPDMARSLGRSLRILRTELKQSSEDAGQLRTELSSMATSTRAAVTTAAAELSAGRLDRPNSPTNCDHAPLVSPASHGSATGGANGG